MAFRLEVKNFQSIEHADLEIDQLTVITGTNSAGKSALVRAFKGVFVNSPAKNLVRKGAEDLEVDITFSDGNKVSWKKGKNSNAYIINGDEKENVSRGAPEDISTLGILPVEVTGSQKKQFWPQIAQQLDSVLFVLGEPGTSIAEVVVSDVDKVFHLNQALSLSEKQRREFRAEEKIRRKDLEVLESKIEQLGKIRDISNRNKDMMVSLDRIKSLLERRSQLENLQQKWIKTREERIKLSSLSALSFPELSSLSKSYEDLVRKARIFQRLKAIKVEREKLSQLKGLHIPIINVDIKILSTLENMNTRLTKIRGTLQEVGSLRVKLETLMKENDEKIAEYKVCPTCGATAFFSHQEESEKAIQFFKENGLVQEPWVAHDNENSIGVEWGDKTLGILATFPSNGDISWVGYEGPLFHDFSTAQEALDWYKGKL